MAAVAQANSQVQTQPKIALPWWQTRRWTNYFSNCLKYYSQRRWFSLSINPTNPLGAMNPVQKRVYLNPEGVEFPATEQHCTIRYMVNDPLVFQQNVAWAIIAHEAGHIRISGEKPKESTLGWLWNALEDGRLERWMAAQYTELQAAFDFLGDVVWVRNKPTKDMLAGCLLWRWEWNKTLGVRKFTPDPKNTALWEKQVRPLVEKAWSSASSDEVVEIAKAILKLLGIKEDAPTDALPKLGCATGEDGNQPGDGSGKALSKAGNAVNKDTEAPQSPIDAKLPGCGSGAGTQGDPRLIPLDPHALLQEVEGFARDLATALKPPMANQRPLPHASRGEFCLERALEKHSRPFDHVQSAAPPRSLAVKFLVDLSGSMGHADQPLHRMYAAIRATMLINRACELAQANLGIWGFRGDNVPIVVRPMSAGTNEQAAANIAGMTGRHGTTLATVFKQAIDTLMACPQKLKVLIVIHDGELVPRDSQAVRTLSDGLRSQGILLLPIYLGNSIDAIESNRASFGLVLPCENLIDLAPKIRAWLRAVTAS